VAEYPTGAQILEAANVIEVNALLQRLPNGDLETIRMAESPDLDASAEFILSFGNRIYSMSVDGSAMVWAARHISGATLRKLAQVPEFQDLLLLRSDDEPQVLEAGAVVDLSRSGVEKSSPGGELGSCGSKASLWNITCRM
jgi:hypothetical protein